jgi:ATP-dependent DNA helicase DinG
MSDLERIFAPEGPLAAAVPAFRPRPQQVEMAQRIANAIAGNLALVAEAGTGTGKTFAYLVPALLSGGKVIVSTGTKTLQDQLFNRDLPTVRDALKVGASIALLKGRANYVCPYHLERAMSAGRLASREEAAQLRRIARFAERTKTGDKAECIDVPEDSGAWALATSTRENCLGQECPQRQGLLRAGGAPGGADGGRGGGQPPPVLRRRDAEGRGHGRTAAGLQHGHLRRGPPVARGGRPVLRREPVDHSDARTGARHEERRHRRGPDYSPLQDAAQALDKATRDLRLAVKGENLRLPAARLETEADFVAALQEWPTPWPNSAATSKPRPSAVRDWPTACAAARNWRRRSSAGVAAAPTRRWRAADDVVKWVEVYSQAMSLNLTPLDIAPIFQRQMEGHPRAWIFASATLAVGTNFSHYCGELGLADGRHRDLGQPLRLREECTALRTARHARPEQPALPGSGGGSRLAGDPRLGRARLRAVHLLARDAPHPRTAAGKAGRRRPRPAAADAGRGLAHASCWNASATWATRYWSPARASGKAWMYAARRCRWW